MRKKVFRNKSLCLVTILMTALLYPQADTVRLMPPSGPYAVGTKIYEWSDASRTANYTSNKGDRRTLVVQIWYPASLNEKEIRASYSPISKDYQKVLTNSYLGPEFNNSVKRANLILIAPGRGTERFLYSTLSEDLASYGFVVASVDMPLIGYTTFGDGRIVRPSSAFKPPPGMMGGPYEKVDEFFEAPTSMGVKDLDFVYDQLVKLNEDDPDQRFTARLNLGAIGIFGHSLGGRIAGKYTSLHDYVKAYAAMEGIPPREVRFQGKIDIPTAMLCSSGTLPYAKDNYNSFIENAPSAVYFVEMHGFGHNSVTDNPFIYPNSFSYQIDPEFGLKVSREIVSGYFKMLLRKEGDLVKDLKEVEQLSITKHSND